MDNRILVTTVGASLTDWRQQPKNAAAAVTFFSILPAILQLECDSKSLSSKKKKTSPEAI